MSDYLDNPVFICGHRKGGTTVLLCLFDSHPELLTYPADSAFFYQVFPHCETIGLEGTIERVQRHTIRENLNHEMATVENLELFDVEAIAVSYALYARESDGAPSAHLRALIRAYGEHCGQSAEGWTHWVEKTSSTEIYACEIAEWFPAAKFIHLVRDPRDNFGSLKSGWQDRYRHQEDSVKALIQSLLDRGGLGLRMASINESVLGTERYRVVRFEDLARAPRETMEAITEFLGVPYHPALETPTVNGQLWPGNNFNGLSFKALNPVNVGQWAERIEPQEAALIEGHLGDVMEGLGYDLATTPGERAHACSEHYKWFNFTARRDHQDAT